MLTMLWLGHGSEENPLTFVGRKIISTTKYNVSLKMAKTYMQIALKNLHLLVKNYFIHIFWYFSFLYLILCIFIITWNGQTKTKQRLVSFYRKQQKRKKCQVDISLVPFSGPFLQIWSRPETMAFVSLTRKRAEPYIKLGLF